MAYQKRILVLGTSLTGGDWPPVVCVAQGLRERGQALRYFADATIQSTVQHLDIPVVVPAPDRELAAYLAPWLASASEREVPRELADRDSPLTAWSRDNLPVVHELADQFQPDLLLSQLFCVELAVMLANATHLPWCFVNPGVYFGPGARDPEWDYAGLGRFFVRIFQALIESAALVLHGTDPVFDPPPANLPLHHHYVGPLLWEPTAACPAYLTEPGEPWVLVTVSSAPQEGEMALARSALRALSGYPVRVLLTVSEAHPRDELGPIPANARVESFVPHSQVLQRACLSVSHAGHGIVSRSLYYGVPMVLVPWDRDQPGIAFRAAQVGTAEVVTRATLTDERLAAAIGKVLATPSYRQEAARFAERLQSQDAVGTACTLIEGFLADAV
jgi:UDP:flavonoid glycosyltransferase YjiC (YdhE family)